MSHKKGKLLMAQEYDDHPVPLEKDRQLVDWEKDEQLAVSEKKIPLEKPPPRLELKAAFWVDISGFGGH